MAYDLGDVVPLAVNIRDTAGALADATAVVLTLTLPDGTTATPAVTHVSTGVYAVDYTPATAGLHAARWVATGTNASSYLDTFTVTAATPPLALSLADAKRHLNMTSTTDDEELRDTIAAAQDMLERAAGLAFTARTVTEYHDGGGTVLTLHRPPARSLTSVTVDGTLRAATGHRLRRASDATAEVISLAGTFGDADDEVIVVYAAGWTAPPPAAVQAMRVMVAHLWETQRGSMTRRNPFDGAETYGAPGSAYSFPNRVLEALELLTGPGMA